MKKLLKMYIPFVLSEFAKRICIEGRTQLKKIIEFMVRYILLTRFAKYSPRTVVLANFFLMKIWSFSSIAACLMLSITTLTATSLIYTSNQTNYQAYNYFFRKNDAATGFVRLDNGFTVSADACVTLDLLFSVSGALDLRETGTMKLLKDLVLDSGTTFSSGGNIKGYGHTIVLNGNLTIPSGKVVHINGNTTIDGQGNQLTIGSNAQIFVDTDVTLTLCNMTITNQQHSPTFPPIRCAALTSKLALNDVVFTPIGDFLFPQGQLFIHDDVMVTGTSAFIYTSPVPSFITSGACWYFGTNTTFSVAPSTFTDASYSLRTTYTNNNFIKMADTTSMLYLDGCNLFTTPTGCRFTKGTIILDNNVVCRSDTTLTLTSITVRAQKTYGTAYVFDLSWSPNEKFLAVGGQSPTSGNELQIYRFDGINITLIPGAVDYGTAILSVNWSPDGRYLALGGSAPTSGYRVQVYSFNGTTTLTQLLEGRIVFGSNVRTLDWSPDGKYLAAVGVGATNGNMFQVYKFNGTLLSTCTWARYGSAGALSLSWHPGGRYIAVGGEASNNGNNVQTYYFDGLSLSLLPLGQVNAGGTILSEKWSPDGKFLALGCTLATGNYVVQVYRFDGTSLVALPGARLITGGYVHYHALQWSSDGKYLAAGIRSPTAGKEIQVYSFDGVNLTAVNGAQIDYAAYCSTLRWSPDSRFLAVGGSVPNIGHTDLEVYKSNYIPDTTTTLTSMSRLTGEALGGYVINVNWSPDGNFVAVGSDAQTDPYELRIYSFDGTNITVLPGTEFSYGLIVQSTDWRYDQKYLAIGGGYPSGGHRNIEVYSFDGSNLTVLPGTQISYGTYANSVKWTSDGQYLAVGGHPTLAGYDDIQVFSFDGSLLTTCTMAHFGSGGSVYSVAWRLGEQYLAVGGTTPANGNEVQVYSFNGSSLTLLPSAQVNYGTKILSVAWSPDGRFLAIGGTAISGNELQIYSFDGTSLTLVTGFDFAGTIYSLKWSPDGKYIGAAGSGNNIRLFSFYEGSLTSVCIEKFGSRVQSIDWRPDQNFIAIGGYIPNAGHTEFEIYNLTYYYNQTLSNSIVFGDSAKGSTYDANVNVLSGALVKLQGAMSYDNVN
jgi:WD40 repeat protein